MRRKLEQLSPFQLCASPCKSSVCVRDRSHHHHTRRRTEEPPIEWMDQLGLGVVHIQPEAGHILEVEHRLEDQLGSSGFHIPSAHFVFGQHNRPVLDIVEP